MMKKIYLLFIALFFITGCENKEEERKSEYIAVKSNLLSATDYEEDLPLEIIVSLDRVEEEKINYKVVFQNPEENMHHIKAMIVHNYHNEDVFPSVGVFDEVQELLVEGEESKSLELHGTFESAKNMNQLDLQLKIWIEYQDDNGKIKNIYYRA